MNIEAEKLGLIQWLAQLSDEKIIAKIIALRGEESFTLSAAHKNMLDDRKQRHVSQEGNNYSWEEVRKRARKALD